MIPRLGTVQGLDTTYRQFLDELRNTSFSGDLRSDYATRLITSTDNSVYQIVPQAVVYPKSAQDVEIVLRLLAEPRFAKITLSPRGGGTGTNGQSLSEGLILDLSRHMNGILELNVEEGWVRVQPGVVLDQLNAFLKPHKVFFAPNLSPSNRATLGGMINTDACGKGSRVYGKTSNHICELSVVFVDGTPWVSKPLTELELDEAKQQPGIVGQIYKTVDEIVTENADKVREQFPKLQRFLTGYNLAHVRSAEQPGFNLNYILAGSEGTLAVVTEARLKLTPLPACKELIAIKYHTFDDALRAANVLVEANPGAIETIDDTILKLARQDTIWHQISHMLHDQPGEHAQAINLVEFESDQAEIVEEQMKSLLATLEANKGQPEAAFGYYVAKNAQERASLWELRKKGVGLLGNIKGDRRPIAFVEDTAVPPVHLAAYIKEFRALLEQHGLQYGMFGHVDVGCLHVRPALNMRDPKDEQLLRQISDQVVRLVMKYGGVMWSEHGKGFRSEYSPLFFGEELYECVREVKRVFDPNNRLNPGKLATPKGSSATLVGIDALKRGAFDRQIDSPALEKFEAAVACNGNGACFNYDPDSVMCPSSKITRDRIHSPKGRAGMMREWMRQMNQEGKSSSAVTDSASPIVWAQKVQNSWKKSQGEYDFSHEVYQAMNGCLACKACTTQCPIQVDVPAFKSEFLNAYHTRYTRPVKDYFVSGLEDVVVWMAKVPHLCNWFFSNPLFQSLLSHTVGMVDSPLLSTPTMKEGLKARGLREWQPSEVAKISPEMAINSIVLLQDAFTSFYEVPVALGLIDLLQKLDYHVIVLPFRANGKGIHIKGFLDKFAKVAARNVEWLKPVFQAKVPVIGIDPAVVLTYRDEYPHALGKEAMASINVKLLQEWFQEQQSEISKRLHKQGYKPPRTEKSFTLLGHCTERTAFPKSAQFWQQTFHLFGLQLQTPSLGCCGMCGAFGHEKEHVEESKGIYQLSWEHHTRGKQANDQTLVVTGHSCRSQVKRMEGVIMKHPVQILLSELNEAHLDKDSASSFSSQSHAGEAG
jgi:FAD/FMN-containing dehydrogenase/Fe-S oxidoreductase